MGKTGGSNHARKTAEVKCLLVAKKMGVDFMADNLEEDAKSKGLPPSHRRFINNMSHDPSEGEFCRGSIAMLQNINELKLTQAIDAKLPTLKDYVTAKKAALEADLQRGGLTEAEKQSIEKELVECETVLVFLEKHDIQILPKEFAREKCDSYLGFTAKDILDATTDWVGIGQQNKNRFHNVKGQEIHRRTIFALQDVGIMTCFNGFFLYTALPQKIVAGGDALLLDESEASASEEDHSQGDADEVEPMDEDAEEGALDDELKAMSEDEVEKLELAAEALQALVAATDAVEEDAEDDGPPKYIDLENAFKQQNPYVAKHKNVDEMLCGIILQVAKGNVPFVEQSAEDVEAQIPLPHCFTDTGNTCRAPANKLLHAQSALWDLLPRDKVESLRPSYIEGAVKSKLMLTLKPDTPPRVCSGSDGLVLAGFPDPLPVLEALSKVLEVGLKGLKKFLPNVSTPDTDLLLKSLEAGLTIPLLATYAQFNAAVAELRGYRLDFIKAVYREYADQIAQKAAADGGRATEGVAKGDTDGEEDGGTTVDDDSESDDEIVDDDDDDDDESPGTNAFSVKRLNNPGSLRDSRMKPYQLEYFNDPEKDARTSPVSVLGADLSRQISRKYSLPRRKIGHGSVLHYLQFESTNVFASFQRGVDAPTPDQQFLVSIAAVKRLLPGVLKGLMISFNEVRSSLADFALDKLSKEHVELILLAPSRDVYVAAQLIDVFSDLTRNAAPFIFEGSDYKLNQANIIQGYKKDREAWFKGKTTMEKVPDAAVLQNLSQYGVYGPGKLFDFFQQYRRILGKNGVPVKSGISEAARAKILALNGDVEMGKKKQEAGDAFIMSLQALPGVGGFPGLIKSGDLVAFCKLVYAVFGDKVKDVFKTALATGVVDESYLALRWAKAYQDGSLVGAPTKEQLELLNTLLPRAVRKNKKESELLGAENIIESKRRR